MNWAAVRLPNGTDCQKAMHQHAQERAVKGNSGRGPKSRCQSGTVAVPANGSKSVYKKINFLILSMKMPLFLRPDGSMPKDWQLEWHAKRIPYF